MSELQPKNITLREENAQGAPIYPKTSITQVDGLEARLSEIVASIPESNNSGEAVAEEKDVEVLTDFDFAAVPESTGLFKVDSSLNSPFGGEKGYINISKDEDDNYLEVWKGEKFSAYKLLGEVNPIEVGLSSLTINGTNIDVSVDGSPITGITVNTNATIVKDLDNGAEVVLEAGREYNISGSLVNTRIRVAGVADENTVTTLNLNGLYILFNNFIDVEDEDNLEKRVKGWEPMIQTDVAGKTVINLVSGSKNYLIREKEETMPEPDSDGLYGMNHSTGVIYSTEGTETLEIKGDGFLSIKSMLGGHAIKSKGNLLITGSPKIRARAYHDILHGNASVTVRGGYVYAEWCNDFFGADTADGDQAVGLITVESGDFYIKWCNETFLQGDNARIWPNMRLTYEHIGEGLWLQCKPGQRLFEEDGKIKGLFTLDYENHTFVYHELKKKGMLNVAGWAKEEFWTPIEFAAHPDPITALLSIPEGNKSRIIHTTDNVYGIVTFVGVDAKISGPTTEPDYSETFFGTRNRTTPRATQAANETAVSAMYGQDSELDIASEVPVLENYSEIFPTVESNNYNETVFTGKWVTITNIEKLNSEKNALNKSIKALLSAIVPVKTLSISAWKHGEKLVNDDSDTPVPFVAPDESLLAVNTGKAIGTGKDTFSSKTGNVPTIKLRKGEWVRIYAHIDPANTTNVNLKWTNAAQNENTVIYVRKSEDTQYCDVLGVSDGDVQEGQFESVILSAKGLDKSGAIVKMAIRFHVVAKEAGYELIDLPEEKTEFQLLKDKVDSLSKEYYGQFSVVEGEEEVVKLDGILPEYAAGGLSMLENYILLNGSTATVCVRFEVLADYLAPAINGSNIYSLPIEYTLSEAAPRVPMGHVPVYAEKDLSDINGVNLSGAAMMVDGTQVGSVFFISADGFAGPGLYVSAPLPAGKYWIQGTMAAVRPEFFTELFSGGNE